MSLTRLQVLSVLLGAVAAISVAAIFPSRAWGQSKPKMPEHRGLCVAYFALHATWRTNDFPGEDSPFVIGILGDDPLFIKEIEPIKGSKIQKHTVQFRTYQEVEEVVVSRCHVLFICKSEKRRLTGILKPLRGLRVLTISDAETKSDAKEFFDAGGVASIVVKPTGLNVDVAIPDLSKKAVSTNGGWEFKPELFKFMAEFDKIR